MRLYVDDLRPVPEDWLIARNYDFAIRVMTLLPLTAISLDHDLGEGKTGYDIAKWMVEHNVCPQHIYCHSANPVGRFNILQLLEHYAPEGVTVHH